MTKLNSTCERDRVRNRDFGRIVVIVAAGAVVFGTLATAWLLLLRRLAQLQAQLAERLRTRIVRTPLSFAAADAVMYAAKQAGRNRVMDAPTAAVV